MAVFAAVVPVAFASPEYSVERGIDLKQFDAGQIALLEKLNRADRKHLARLPEVVVPNEWGLDELAYSPMPAYSEWAAERGGKALIIDIPGQVFGAYEDGTLVRWGPISSGKKGNETPAGLKHLSWRSRIRRSTIDESWIMEWYFNFEPRRGIAMHKYTLPGRPASHACVRLLERDAKWIYEWGEEPRNGRKGTPVWLVGEYDFDAPPPWRAPELLAERLAALGQTAD